MVGLSGLHGRIYVILAQELRAVTSANKQGARLGITESRLLPPRDYDPIGQLSRFGILGT